MFKQVNYYGPRVKYYAPGNARTIKLFVFFQLGWKRVFIFWLKYETKIIPLVTGST